jgi:riboflavin synthase
VVRDARPTAGGGRRLTIDVGALAEGLKPGDSVAVDGACLTACAIRGPLADFDAVGETVSRTTLADVRAGAKVNLERPLRLDGRLDGHIVQGHVDGVAEIRRIDKAGDQWSVEFAAPAELTSGMVEKGSAAVNGVSLTLTAVGDGTFSVALIPTTVAETTFGELGAGAKVNVETDVIGKYVRRYLGPMAAEARPCPAEAGRPAGGLTFEKLRDAGFA